MTATIRTRQGVLVKGVIKDWHGDRRVEIEDAFGHRYVGVIVEPKR